MRGNGPLAGWLVGYLEWLEWLDGNNQLYNEADAEAGDEEDDGDVVDDDDGNDDGRDADNNNRNVHLYAKSRQYIVRARKRVRTFQRLQRRRELSNSNSLPNQPTNPKQRIQAKSSFGIELMLLL